MHINIQIKFSFRGIVFHIFNNNEKSLIFCSTWGQRRMTILPHIKRKKKKKKGKVFSASRTYRAKLSCCRQIIDRRKNFFLDSLYLASLENSLVRTTDSCDIFANASKGGISDQRYEKGDFVCNELASYAEAHQVIRLTLLITFSSGEEFLSQS